MNYMPLSILTFINILLETGNIFNTFFAYWSIFFFFSDGFLQIFDLVMSLYQNTDCFSYQIGQMTN